MKRNREITVLLFIFMIVVSLTTFSYGSSIPQKINYSGSLTDTGGTPVPDGQYDVEFNIYNVPTGGTALWTETWNAATTKVVVSRGNFNAILGAHAELPASFFADNPVTYLGVKVGTDSEMLPRQRITSVGYAFTAGDGVPKGGIIMWSGAEANIPAGWALCDGTNGTPDLRSRFIVGRGQGAGLTLYNDANITGGEEKHTLTITEIPSHTHIQNAHNHGVTDPGHTHSYTAENGDGQNKMRAGTDGDGTYGPYSYSILSNTTGITINNQIATNQSIGGLNGITQAHENRPPYYALAFIMKL
ncbi:MAG: hypothetical protein HZC48_10075 [Nitrospirae bacterium]|nr:hypothetical protein [Nitrospirota bacterium]